jgi:hypothetical protein
MSGGPSYLQEIFANAGIADALLSLKAIAVQEVGVVSPYAKEQGEKPFNRGQ